MEKVIFLEQKSTLSKLLHIFSSEFEREVACEETDRFILSVHNMEKVARYVDFVDICVRCHMVVQVGQKLC